MSNDSISFKEFVAKYIRDNLKINLNINKEYGYDDSCKTISVELTLEGETIGYTTAYLD
jgi:uncharacterized protein YfaS (alpha-2-macroglobulin family)